jgi:cytochrome c oxidase assembly protein subunit 15
MIILTTISAFKFSKTSERPIFTWSVIALVLVIFQGWLGALVVSSELHPIMVTTHMLVAIVIVFILLYVYARSYVIEKHVDLKGNAKSLNPVLVISLILSLLQIVLGTQVREDMDHVIVQLGYDLRSEWIENLGLDFYIHRSFTFLIIGINVWLFMKTKKLGGNFRLYTQLASYILVSIGLTVLMGIIMAYFGVPPFAQPLHLTLAIVMIGIQFVLLMFINSERFFGSREYYARNLN